eukprot:2632309-Pyramimonas_sp.AAC.2
MLVALSAFQLCGEYSRPQPTGRTRAENIPGLSQRGGLVRRIFRASANRADSCGEYSGPRPMGRTSRPPA